MQNFYKWIFSQNSSTHCMCISESSPVPWGNPHQGVEIKLRDLGDRYRTWFVNHWTLSTIIAAKTRRNLRDELCSHTPVSESPWSAQRGLVKFIRETDPRVQLSATSQHKQQDRLTPVTQRHKNIHVPIHSLLTNGSYIPHKYWSWGGNLYLLASLLCYFLGSDEFCRKYHGNILKGHTVFLKSVSSLKMYYIPLKSEEHINIIVGTWGLLS